MFFNKKITRRVWLLFSCIAFLYSTIHFSLHKLEHINDPVCISSSFHFHTNEHDDTCKDLNFFVFQKFIEFNYSYFLNFQIRKYFVINNHLVCSFLIYVSNKSPPICT